MAWRILNKRVVPYSQKDGTKLVYGDAVTISIEMPTPHQEGDRYVLGIDWEAAPYPPSRPLCAGSKLFTIEDGVLTFADVQTGTSRFREWICRQRKPAPVHVQIVRLRGSTAETLLLDDLLALPSVIDGEITVIEGDPLADLLDQKLDRPAVSGEAGDVLRMGDGLPVWGAWPQADWDESDSTADAFIKGKPEIPSKVSDLDNDLGYVTEEDISETLQGYVTGSDLSDTLNSYATKADVSETLQSYPTKADVSETLQGYVTGSDLSDTLNSYATKQDVSDALQGYVQYDDLSDALSGYVTDGELSDTLENYVTDADLSDAVSGKLDAPAGGEIGDVLTKTATGQAWQTVDAECYAYNLPIDTVADEAFAESDSVSVSFAAWDPGDRRVAVIPFTGSALAFPSFTTSEAANRLRTVELWFKQRAGAGAISPIATPPGCHVAGSNFPSWLEADSDSYTPYTYHIFTARYMPNGSATPYELAYQHSWPTSADIGGGPGAMCLTLENRGDSAVSISLDKVGTLADRSIEYSTDGGWNWTAYSWTGNTGDSVAVPAGGNVRWRGVNASTADSASAYLHFTIPDGNQFAASGSVTSLLDGNGESRDAGTTGYSLACLFQGTGSLVDASGLLMPTTLGNTYQCNRMFRDCTALTTAPALPATTLQGNCYDQMFYGCSALTAAPELPATTLEGGCYNTMFRGCTSLATAPVLPAETLTSNCYRSMFYGCTSLTTAPALPATTLASYCYQSMFQGCTALLNAPALPVTTLADQCYQDMFNGCTALVNAPSVLPATSMTINCYRQMFQGCKALTAGPEIMATSLYNYCLYHMFYNSTLLSSLKVHFTSWSNNDDWLYGVSATGTFTCPSGLNTNTRNASRVPANWTVVNI